MSRVRLAFLLALLAGTFCAAMSFLLSSGEPPRTAPEPPRPPPAGSGEADPDRPPVSHAILDTLLKRYVRDGVVDYAGMKQEEAQMDEYLRVLNAADPDALSEKGQLAFWINAYNAFTLKLILEHYPVEGIKKTVGVFADPWDLDRWWVGGHRTTLNRIEHEIVRPRYRDPRAHFALVCAARSCPDLRGETYEADRLDAQLDDAGRGFLADPTKGARLEEGRTPTLYLSKIFDWYGGDFGEGDEARVRALSPYLPESIRSSLEGRLDRVRIRYMSYDWSLNGRQEGER
ncbi:MAG: DUF547 domain-containing protein [Planctomycetes bacterium]|nr:DUF547 domain-containing protein [Planctomycetota bacterium]